MQTFAKALLDYLVLEKVMVPLFKLLDIGELIVQQVKSDHRTVNKFIITLCQYPRG